MRTSVYICFDARFDARFDEVSMGIQWAADLKKKFPGMCIRNAQSCTYDMVLYRRPHIQKADPSYSVRLILHFIFYCCRVEHV